VIRDPKRIIYLYELAVVLAMAGLLRRLPIASAHRISIAMVVLVLLVTDRSNEIFEYARPIDEFDRRVAASIDIDPSCKSFFIKGASRQYMSRSDHMWSLYGLDSMFVALNHSIPTLNGYSAWVPQGWELQNPQEATYPNRVRRWIEANDLRNVCEFDIEARTMRPRIP
jgi:hypothetical protein